MGSYERSGFASGWLCAFLWYSVLLCSVVGSTFYCPRCWRVLCLWSSTRRRSGAWPFFFSPCCRSPPYGVGSASAAWRVLSFTCAMPGGVFLSWLACWLLSWVFTFLFRAASLWAGCLGFYASFLPGEGSWFLRLAWRYGCCFWRRPFPYPWCFPDAGSTVSVSTCLGWFAILEVLVLKSRVSPFLLVSYASRVVP